MIICSCNVLSHTDIENAVRNGASRPAEIYASRRCKAQCGNCVPGVLCLLRAALAQAALKNAAQACSEAGPEFSRI